MKVEKIITWVIRVKDLLPLYIFDNFLKYIESIKYDAKHLEGVFNYDINVYWEEQNNENNLIINNLIWKKLILLPKLFDKLYWVNTKLNNFWSFIRLNDKSFISKHSDLHSDIQCVYHFNNYFKWAWWELIIYIHWKKHIIYPEKNSIICFSWELVHSVTTYNLLLPRYSWSFGYSLYNNINMNYEKFCLSLKWTLYK